MQKKINLMQTLPTSNRLDTPSWMAYICECASTHSSTWLPTSFSLSRLWSVWCLCLLSVVLEVPGPNTSAQSSPFILSFLKGTMHSDCLGLRKIFKPFRNTENTCQSKHVPIVSQKMHKFDRKTAFYQISFCGPWALFLCISKFPKFQEKVMCFSFNKSHKTPKITKLYFKKGKYCCPKWKNKWKLQKIKI